jgi:hypothetical protein
MKTSIRPKEIRIHFVCLQCGTHLWIYAEEEYGNRFSCYRCKKSYSWGVSVVQVTEQKP